MSTITKEFTKEQLQQIIETDHVQCGEASSLARIALASLEAEPVAEVYQPPNVGICAALGVSVRMLKTLRAGDKLYTAHPAPVSVPAAMEMDDDFDSAFEHGKAVGWNAYRAAMLQSFGNSEQLNSPVIQDGWVACGEQMPEDEQEVIVQNKMGYRYVSYFDEHSGLFFDMRGGNQMNCIEHIFVTHWMPMPAAPQQEA